ncbi:spore coat protein CotJB [Sporanaerobacter acetigenes]|uniref:Spore coat protein JB n=1 Tax=Sporanaerobacter acetigenes DSM 13106 TaxID=1123281 RepID=A0A1M5XBI3_9FIRM|nr:spore coat protein CotJB [Sporanaerobacter acetigenes]SHH97136.1 spore coat protein JB [Sporanaerobacter acetigenes DSM 13106]
MDREQVCSLREIMEVDFVVLETALYLNTHPTDERALRLHNTYSQKLKELESIYQAKYGPLTNHEMSQCPWAYINEPWPWEFDFSLC